jgi:PAS domain S-box-containing protein
VAELERTNRALRVLSSINQAVLHATAEDALMLRACTIAVDLGGYRMAWVGMAEHDPERSVCPVCFAGHEAGYLTDARVSWADTEQGRGPSGTAIRTGTPVLQPDIAVAPEFAPWRDAALARGYRSNIALPLRVDDAVIGALTLYGGMPNGFYPEEVQLLEELAENLSFGIATLRAQARHRETEDALRVSEEKFRMLIEDAPVAIGMARHGISTYANPSFIRLFGFRDLADATDHPILEHYAPQCRAQIAEYLKHREHGEPAPTAYEAIGLRADGSPFPMLVAVSRVLLAEGPTVVAFITDITARKQAEDALRASEEKYRSLIDSMTEGVALHALVRDAHGVPYDYRLLDVNPAFTTQTGIAQESARGALASELYGMTPPPFFDVYAQVVDTGVPASFEAFFPPQGKNYQISAFSPGAGLFATVFLDITERIEARETIERERSFLASAIELLPFPIVFITPDREIIRWNHASLELLHAPDHQLWWNIELRDAQTHAVLPPAEWPMSKALRGEQIPKSEWLIVLPDGHEIPALFYTAPIYHEEALVAVVVAMFDLSLLKAADRAKDQFLMVLSHEIKTPLTSIIGWAQVAENAPDLVPEALSIILRNAHRQQVLLERLLTLSRILTGKLTIPRTRLDLWTLALRTAAAYGPTLHERRIALQFEPPTEALPLEGDANLLGQALSEVLDNAGHFTPEGGTITITARREGGEVVLTVQDTGRGIAPTQLDKLATPFTQVQRKEALGGLGIGLSLVRGVIEAHGGHLAISSPGPDHGALITLRLPRAA